MKRRDFFKGIGIAGLLAAAQPAWLSRALAAEPRSPMGKPLGPNQTLLIHNAKLVDVAGSKLFDETALSIRGGKIEKRLTSEEAAKIQADRKIDAGGRYIIPGLINAHCHITMPGIIAINIGFFRNIDEQFDRNCVDCVTHGVTTVRDQKGSDEAIMMNKDRIARGALMGPRIMRGIAVDVPKGYFTGPMGKGTLIASNVQEAKDAVAMAVDKGADHIKLALQFAALFGKEVPAPIMTDEMFGAVVGKAASLGKTVAVHHTSHEGFLKALRAGIQSFEHMTCDAALTDDDLKRFIDGRRAVVPTGSVAWALAFPLKGDANFDHPFVQKIWADKKQRMNSVINEYAIPPIAKIAHEVYEKYSQPGFFDKKQTMTKPLAKAFNAAGAIGGENMMRMYNAGCRIGCGNDGGVPFIWPGGMQLEMMLNEVSGMKPADILRSATVVNSEIISMNDSLGTLDAGKIADAVFLDANPLDTMENVAKVTAVIQSGRLVYTVGQVIET